MNTRTPLFLAMLFTMAINLSACHSNNDDNNDSTDTTTKVGLVLPLTGSLATLGVSLQNATDLALEEVNSSQDQKIEFVIEDSESTPESAVKAFNKLIDQDGISSIIGPTTSSETQAAFPIAQQNKVVSFSPLAAAAGLSNLGDFVFQANLTVDVVIPGGVAITKAKFGYQKVAMLVDSTDLFSESAAEILNQTFINQGIDVVSTEFLVTGDTDFSAQLGRIRDTNPDAIFISTLPIEAVEILTQASAAGIPDNVTFIVPLAFSSDEVASAGAAAEGVVTFSTWVSSANTPGNQAFIQNYQAKYGAEPSRFLAQQYATVHIFAEALRNAQSLDSSGIRDALAGIKDFDTVLGKFSFKENGSAIYDPIILVVKDGKLEVFE